jgi:hypothetical protein
MLIRGEWRGIVRVAHSDAAMRKLAPKVQACLQCLGKDSIFRFCYSVDFDNVTFGRQVIGDIARHEKPPSFVPTADLFKQSFGCRRHRVNI